MFKQLDDTMFASPQITPVQVREAAAQDITLIVNNRPDDEDPEQPAGAAIASAAREAGIDYVAIPVTHAGFSLPQVEAMQKALDANHGKTLGFCRSGTRSALLWALTQAHRGHDPDTIAEQAQAAGYDVAPVRSIMDAFAAAK